MRCLALVSVLLAFRSPANAQPDAAGELLRQAIAAHQAGDFPSAIAAYEKYLAVRPESPIALSNLGMATAYGFGTIPVLRAAPTNSFDICKPIKASSLLQAIVG